MTLVRAWADSPFTQYAKEEPWTLTAQSDQVVRNLLARLPREEYRVRDDIALHKTAIIEDGATLKGPLILGQKNGFVAAGAYLRGGNWIGANCIFGPGVELKSSFVFSGTKLTHFNFVGDSILGEAVNLEAGSIVCNYRNERADKEILVRVGQALRRTGQTKFGALIGDGCRIGANAVLAPGTILSPGTIVRRGTLVDPEQ